MIFKKVWCTIIVTSFRVQVLCLCEVNLCDVLHFGDNYKLARNDSLPNCFVRIIIFQALRCCDYVVPRRVPKFCFPFTCCTILSVRFQTLERDVCLQCQHTQGSIIRVCISITYHICCRICAKCNIRTDQFCKHFPIFSVAWDWVQISSLLRSPLLAFSSQFKRGLQISSDSVFREFLR